LTILIGGRAYSFPRSAVVREGMLSVAQIYDRP
jgi:hypothetical protein